MNGLGGLQVGEDNPNALTPSAILNHLPSIQDREYFWPRRHKLRSKSSKPTSKQGHVHTTHVTSLEDPTSDLYLEFDPFNDVKVGHFLALNSSIDDIRLGIFFSRKGKGYKKCFHRNMMHEGSMVLDQTKHFCKMTHAC